MLYFFALLVACIVWPAFAPWIVISYVGYHVAIALGMTGD